MAVDSKWREAREILVVRLDSLGDVLVTTPAFRAIRRALPDARLTLLASSVGAQVGRLDPDVGDVIVYEAPWMDPWHRLPQDPAREQAAIACLRERRFDAAVIFTSFRQSPLPSAYLCYLAGIPLRLAASIDGPGSLLTTRHRHPESVMHEVERGLDLVGAVGIPAAQLDLVLQVPRTAHEEIAALVADSQTRSKKMVVLHPGCSMPARTYPAELFADVLRRLIAELGATVFLTGTEDERELVGSLITALPDEQREHAIAVAGELSFAGLCALIETADVTVTNNTGPMHVAAAVKTPVVALFALTNIPEQWAPWRVEYRQLYRDVPCRICYSRVCPYNQECLRGVTPQMVIEAAGELLSPGVAA